MEHLWTLFCGHSSHCTTTNSSSAALCSPQFMSVFHSSSCVNHVFVVCFNILLQVFLLYTKFISKKGGLVTPPNRLPLFAQKLSAVYNGCLGLVYIGYGIGVLGHKLRYAHSISPLHWWIIFLFHGVTWLLLGLTSLRGEFFPRLQLRILFILGFLYAGIFCFLALFTSTVNHKISVKGVLDILSFVGANFLLLCIPDEEDNDSSNNTNQATQVTPFSKAGLFSKISFCWLNPLMKLGKNKTLVEDDVPRLREVDTASFCYSQYLDRLSKHNEQSKPLSESLVLWTILGCYWKEILMSAFFAFLKTTTLSSGPIFLYFFIQVAEGKDSFKFEGCVLALALLISKILESLSQRLWFFRARLIGVRVRSMLIAAIFKKQLKLSNVAKGVHSGGMITNYVTVDAYRIGEFSFWFHQTWTTVLQLCFALVIMMRSVGLATIAALLVTILTMICNTPLAKLQQKFQRKLMVAQDERLKTCSEALVNMKVLKLYAWETHFKGIVEGLRKVEYKWLSAVQLQKAFNFFVFWSSPILVSFATFGTCYIFHIPLHASNVFTFLATSTLLQQPISTIPNVIEVVIHARLSFSRIVKFLSAPELQIENVRKTSNMSSSINYNHAIVMKSANLSWEMNPSKPSLRNLNLVVCRGEKVAICGEVGVGKSTLLAAILGEVPYIEGTVEAYGRMACVSQTAWIQSGTIRDNILFGSEMNNLRYEEALRTCSLVKDLELLPYGDMTEIGERGINLSGGQKQRIQLARALYQDADIYLLDDPFSAVDAHTATSILNDYVMGALCEKTVLLVTHQVDFLPAFHCCLLMSDGGILHAGPYHKLLAASQEFSELVNAHKETAGSENMANVGPYYNELHNRSIEEIKKSSNVSHHQELKGDQLIKQEEREVGDTGLKPYLIYLMQKKGWLYSSIFVLAHLLFVTCVILQNVWMASSVDNPHITKSKLIVVYVTIGCGAIFFLFIRALAIVKLGMESSKSLFSRLLNSLYRAPVSFYDCTPLGRILSRISSDLSIVDVDIPFSFQVTFGATILAYTTLGVMAMVTWQVMFVTIPVVYMVIRLQRYYFKTAKELMRLNGTTKSMLVNHLTESMAGAMTIRAFREEDRFFAENLNLIDTNARPFFHNFAATEWLIQRIEILSSTVLAAVVLCIVLLPRGTLSSGYIGLVLSYGLTLNMCMFFSIQMQCTLANQIISVERLNQYMDIPSEAAEVINDRRPPQNWPLVGKVEICNLEVRYRLDTPLVLQGITCTFEGGDNIGIVGRTGSGKTTLIGALFRLVEPVGGKILVDGVDIGLIGLHDLRSHFGIIPQDPTLFNGTIRFNLDPLCQHNDENIWEVLEKCQLKDVVKEKNQGLDSLVVEDGSNWSMGQRQLFCLGRALLRKSKVLVLDEATASIDNATDTILQKTIRTEFCDSTVIIIAHRIPTVMDCSKVLAISDGKLMEFDEPMKLLKEEGSLFGQLVKEYWSHIHSADQFH